MLLRTFEGSSFLSVGLVLATMAVSACGDGRITPVSDDPLTSTELCFEFQRDLVSIISRDAIPALTDPTMVPADDNKANYLLPTDRVLPRKPNRIPRIFRYPN